MVNRDDSIYDDVNIKDKFIEYVRKYSMHGADDFAAAWSRVSKIISPDEDCHNNPWDEVLNLSNDYPDRKHVTFDFTWMQFCDYELAHTLEVKPGVFLEQANKAIEEIDLPTDADLKNIRVQINGYPHHSTIGDALKVRSSGTFTAIQGVVRTKGKIEKKLTDAAWMCMRCENVSYEPQGDSDKEIQPDECENESCGKKGPYKLIHELSTKRDFQIIELQESPNGLNGRQPKSIIIHLYDNLTDSVEVGEEVIISGTIKDVPKSYRNGNSNRYTTVLEANYISTSRDDLTGELSEDDMRQIMQLSQCENVEDMMVQSLAPSVYGYADIKKALIYQMFGGCGFWKQDGTWSRGDIHILLLGDPGVAKSQMQRRVVQLSPRATLASGKGASGVGLTAAARADPMNDGQWVLDAGALPMADGGICCIDEFDKVGDDDKACMHDAMEQQTLQIDKAGIHANLSTKCGILSCANPKSGRFNDFSDLADEINTIPSLLSRFEMIYIIRDVPQRARDEKVARQILKSRRISARMNAKMEVTEEEKKMVRPEIPDDIFRKYIGYARANVTPLLTEEVEDVLIDFYLNLRDTYKVTNIVSIAPRFLEGLCRLTEASAKLHLRDEVTLGDAQNAKSMMSNALQVFMDEETGVVDMSAIEYGGTHSQLKKVNLVRDILSRSPGIPFEELTKQTGYSDEDMHTILAKLGERGEVMQTGPDKIMSV